MEFKDTLELHLQSIKDKNLDIFLSTVSKEEVVLIMPDGNIIDEKEKFESFHQDWFMDEDWSLHYELLKVIESVDMCSALLKINYRDCDPEGQPIKINYYLNLVFKKFKDQWLLVFDQNTFFK
ncbi:YybH family protein [Vallitalea okinawensis]|uniref:YybH family protein n=1 Tax=Vallitalea okinawensis TaxID=2078660 RepID=UPI000CFB08CB|nr:DUF4440 domain-containing protein [Vallitalea okinawensis]